MTDAMRSAGTLSEYSIVAVLLRDFSRQPVAEQARLKARLSEVMRAATALVPMSDRIVLDMAEGYSIVALGGSVAALDMADAVQRMGSDLALCIGINYGPLATVTDTGGAVELAGDGLTAALTTGKLATRGRLLASRSFRDSLAAVAPHRAAALAPVGAFADADLRRHELFTVQAAAANDYRRKLLLAFGLAGAGVLGAGVGIRLWRAGAREPGLITFDIAPQGLVYVDGELRGPSPPLRDLQLPPGDHTIEVRNAPHPPLKLAISVKPAQKMTITHSFPGSRRGQGGRDESFVKQLRRKWGF